MFSKYIGTPYDLFNINGVNCWSLVALVYRDLFGNQLVDYSAEENSFQSISAAFTAAFAEGEHGFIQIDEPEDLCVIVMKHSKLQHCGIWFQGKVLHATSAARQVILQDEKDAVRQFKSVEYWQKVS